MGSLDVLWAYQETEKELETFEQELRTTPSRQKLNKLRGFLVDQQNALQRITSEAEVREQQVRQMEKKHSEALDNLQKCKDRLQTNAPESLPEAQALRGEIESLHEAVTGQRKELYNTVTWLEKLDTRLGQMRREIGKAKKEYDALKLVCEKEIEDAGVKLSELKQKTAEAGKLVDGALMNRYKAIKANHALPLAHVEGNQCGGCNMELPVVVMRRLKDPAVLVECENCGRILLS